MLYYQLQLISIIGVGSGGAGVMYNVSTTIRGQSKDGIAARLKTPWQSNSGIQCIHDHPWTVQGWHSSQAQDPLAK